MGSISFFFFPCLVLLLSPCKQAAEQLREALKRVKVARRSEDGKEESRAAIRDWIWTGKEWRREGQKEKFCSFLMMRSAALALRR
jgi:hypothetical protein